MRGRGLVKAGEDSGETKVASATKESIPTTSTCPPVARETLRLKIWPPLRMCAMVTEGPNVGVYIHLLWSGRREQPC
jgi:hypothetical protein